jgi:hypothetical protein
MSLFVPGAARFPLFAGLLFLPAPIAAAASFALHTSIFAGVGAGVVITAACAWLLRNRLPQPLSPVSRASSLLGERLAMLFTALLACSALYSTKYGGLPAWVSSDSGNHAGIMRDLFRSITFPYGGCVSLHVAWHLIELLFHSQAFFAFALLFYGTVALAAALPLAIVLGILSPLAPRARTLGLIGASAGALAGLFLVVLPLLSYLQVEGFWPQIIALIPLLLLWWLDVSLDGWWQRVLAWTMAAVLFRYTYGLNLGELLVAVAVVAVLESPERLLPLAVAYGGAVLVVAGMALKMFDEVSAKWGWFVVYDLIPALRGLLIGLAGLVLAFVGNRPATARLALGRALRLPLFVSFGGWLVTSLYRGHLPRSYYILKYPILGICLTALAGAVVCGAVAALLVERHGLRDWLWALGCVAAIAASTGYAWYSFQGYHPVYYDRILGRTSKELRPLADLEAWKRIDATVLKEKKKFGGYLVAYGPMSNFMNSAMGVGDGQTWYFQGRPPHQEPGYCVFWDATHPDPWPDFNRWYRHRWIVDRLERDKTLQCEDYSAAWDSSLHRRICHVCK